MTCRFRQAMQRRIMDAPVASCEPIKLMSGDVGGAFNANSGHPFEHPTPLSNVLETAMMLLGRYLPMIFVVALAGTFAARRQVAADGSLDTDGPRFVSLDIGATLLVVGPEFSLCWPSDQSPRD